MHDGLASDADHEALEKELHSRSFRVLKTRNVQTKMFGVDDIINRRYARSELIVTTRLHGAIIAYGMGIPYVALARDEKVRAFTRLFGGGSVIESPEDFASGLQLIPAGSLHPDIASVEAFGSRARAWIDWVID
jgi:hypothetical protein